MKNTLLLALIIIGLAGSCAQDLEKRDGDRAIKNKVIVAAAFKNWQDGKAAFFDLLHDDVEWTVSGSGSFAGIYKGKDEFLNKAVTPITEKLSSRIIPELADIIAEDDIVWLHWKGTAQRKSGGTYANEYAWKLKMRDGKIIKVEAFLDTKKLEELMTLNSDNMKATIEDTKDYLGMWVTEDGYVRHALLLGNRYDEARGNRKSAYQGSYKVSGNHIDYKDDTGFTADGDFREGVLYHGGMIFTKEKQK